MRPCSGWIRADPKEFFQIGPISTKHPLECATASYPCRNVLDLAPHGSHYRGDLFEVDQNRKPLDSVLVVEQRCSDPDRLNGCWTT